MHHSISRVLNKTTDYKACSDCNSINWYENTSCIQCDCKKFKPIGKRMINNLTEEYEEAGDWEIEI
jgi:hypothetical protein